jgi:hypothetical protein
VIKRLWCTLLLLAAAACTGHLRPAHPEPSAAPPSIAEPRCDPQAAACLYGRALALGLSARAHPARAGEFLSNMLEDLARAESADANYDEAGPARVRALVLIRAPGWPLGPGDIEAGLVAARRAVALRPAYPPNLLALAEALAKNGDAAGARESYTRAHDAALALPAAADRDQWLREADQGLQRQ